MRNIRLLACYCFRKRVLSSLWFSFLWILNMYGVFRALHKNYCIWMGSNYRDCPHHLENAERIPDRKESSEPIWRMTRTTFESLVIHFKGNFQSSAPFFLVSTHFLVSTFSIFKWNDFYWCPHNLFLKCVSVFLLQSFSFFSPIEQNRGKKERNHLPLFLSSPISSSFFSDRTKSRRKKTSPSPLSSPIEQNREKKPQKKKYIFSYQNF